MAGLVSRVFGSPPPPRSPLKRALSTHTLSRAQKKKYVHVHVRVHTLTRTHSVCVHRLLPPQTIQSEHLPLTHSTMPSSLAHGAPTAPTPRGAIDKIRPTALGGRGTHKKKAVSSSTKAGLKISVARVRRHLRAGKYSTRIGVGAPVYLAAVLEYMCAEVLELAGNAARDNKCKRVTPRHITLAVRHDEELSKYLGRGVHISQGGVLPSIHNALIPQKKAPKTDDEKEAARLARKAKKEKRATEVATEKVAAKAKATAKAAAKAAAKAGKSNNGAAKSNGKGIAKSSKGVTKKRVFAPAPSASSVAIPVTRDDDEPDYDSEAEGSAEGNAPVA